MIETPLVSILTPFLDAAPFLEEAIASVREQDFEHWELLLIDDGSRDASLETARLAAAHNPRIHLIAALDNGPKGAAAARNRGLREARGRYIAFLDADDKYEPFMLSRHISLFEKYNDLAMVYGPTRWWHPDDASLDQIEDMRDIAGQIHEPPDLLEKVILANDSPVPCTCAVTIRRDLLVGICGFEENFRLYEDQTVWARIMLDHRVYVDDKPVAFYRQHAASVSAKTDASGKHGRHGGLPARSAFLDYVDQIVSGHQHEARLRRALRWARWRMRQQHKRWYRTWRRIRRLAIKLRRDLLQLRR